MFMNKFSPSTIEIIDEAIPLLDKISGVGLTALDKFPSDEYSLETFFYITYLNRFVFNIGSVNILIKNIKEHPYIETSIGLTIRTTLLDFMVITYLISYQADIVPDDNLDKKNIFEKEFNSVITDQIYNSIKYVKTAKDCGFLTADSYKTTIDNLMYTYRFLFKDDIPDYEKPESKLISSVFKSPKQYFIRIHNHPIVKDYSMVYDLYIYYSKYDHFGIMTHFMQREDINKDVERIIGSLKYMIRGFAGCLVLLSNPGDKLKKEKTDLRSLQDQFDRFYI